MNPKKKPFSTPQIPFAQDMVDAENTVEAPLAEGKERRELDYYNEEEEDDGDIEEEAEDQEQGEEELEMETEAQGEGEEQQMPKLDEGFFEIEAIRRKRVRKGQLQYLIKWRGWPETSNTWEPLENLQSCSDVIDAFEESLHSGKSSRKRKRKHGGPHTFPKKKQKLSSTSYNNAGVDKSEKSLTRTAKKAEENGHSNGPKHSKQSFGKKEDNEYDPKLSELKGIMCTNDMNENNLAVHFQEGNSSGGNGVVGGPPKLDYMDPVQVKPFMGSKRRKSGSVKRFKKESVEQTCLQSSPLNVTVGLGGESVPLGVECGTRSGANSNHKPIEENSLLITKIIKPIGFSSTVTDNFQDILVSFSALRSDGKEVVVDNKFLKANNPHLLIDFYEQYLKYSS